MRAPVLLAVLAALLAPATAQTASFELLPPSDYSNVEAVSPNGDAVLLWRSASDLREAVWHDGGLTPVGAPQCGPFDSYRAFAVSDDGVPSGVEEGTDSDLWLWHGSACRAVSGPGAVEIVAVSPDGAHGAGTYRDASGGDGTYRGGIVIRGEDTYVIPPQGPGFGVYVALSSLSEDGAVAAGEESRAQGGPIDGVVVRDGVKTTLPILAGDRTTVVDVAGDGTVLAAAVSLTPSAILGHYLFTDKEVLALAPYETAFGSADARAASRGGARVVGSVQIGADVRERGAVLWENGVPRPLAEVLVEYGVDTGAIPAFLTPVDISSNGRVIVGETGSGTDRRVWRAVLPATARWAEAADGHWDDPGRWAPSVVPDSLTAVSLDAAGGATYTITLRDDQAAGSLTAHGTDAIVAFGGHDLSVGDLRVGTEAPASLYLTGGTTTARGDVIVGEGGEGTGELTLAGGHDLAAGGGVVVGAAAANGLSGRLDVFEGRLATAGPLHVGVGDGASGHLVAAPGTTVQVTASSLSVWGDLGSATVDAEGAFVSIVGALVLAQGEGSDATLRLSGGTFFTTTTDLYVGDEGVGDITLTTGASLSTGGQAVVGGLTDSQGLGVVRVEDGARWDVLGYALAVGLGETGGVLLSGSGLLCVAGDLVVGENGLVDGPDPLRVLANTDCISTPSADSAPLSGSTRIGGVTVARLTLADGADLAVPAIEVGEGGVVDGAGALEVPLTNGGTLAPGGDGGLGTLALAEALAQTADGVLAVEVGAAGADAVTVAGTALLGGTLRVTALPGESPTVGQSYAVLTAGSIAGAFDRIEAPDGLAVAVGPTAVTVTVTGPVDAEEDPASGLVLAAPAPNPAAGSVTLGYAIPEAGPVRLAVLDLLGREVARLVDGERPAGTHEVRLDTARLAPGVYIAHLGTEAGGLTRRLTVVR